MPESNISVIFLKISRNLCPQTRKKYVRSGFGAFA